MLIDADYLLMHFFIIKMEWLIIIKKEEKRNDMKRAGSILIAAAVMICVLYSQEPLQKQKQKVKVILRLPLMPDTKARGNFSTEPIGPGASTRKAKVAGGSDRNSYKSTGI